MSHCTCAKYESNLWRPVCKTCFHPRSSHVDETGKCCDGDTAQPHQTTISSSIRAAVQRYEQQEAAAAAAAAALRPVSRPRSSRTSPVMQPLPPLPAVIRIDRRKLRRSRSLPRLALDEDPEPIAPPLALRSMPRAQGRHSHQQQRSVAQSPPRGTLAAAGSPRHAAAEAPRAAAGGLTPQAPTARPPARLVQTNSLSSLPQAIALSPRSATPIPTLGLSMPRAQGRHSHQQQRSVAQSPPRGTLAAAGSPRHAAAEAPRAAAGGLTPQAPTARPPARLVQTNSLSSLPQAIALSPRSATPIPTLGLSSTLPMASASGAASSSSPSTPLKGGAASSSRPLRRRMPDSVEAFVEEALSKGPPATQPEPRETYARSLEAVAAASGLVGERFSKRFLEKTRTTLAARGQLAQVTPFTPEERGAVMSAVAELLRLVAAQDTLVAACEVQSLFRVAELVRTVHWRRSPLSDIVRRISAMADSERANVAALSAALEAAARMARKAPSDELTELCRTAKVVLGIQQRLAEGLARAVAMYPFEWGVAAAFRLWASEAQEKYLPFAKSKAVYVAKKCPACSLTDFQIPQYSQAVNILLGHMQALENDIPSATQKKKFELEFTEMGHIGALLDSAVGNVSTVFDVSLSEAAAGEKQTIQRASVMYESLSQLSQESQMGFESDVDSVMSVPEELQSSKSSSKKSGKSSTRSHRHVKHKDKGKTNKLDNLLPSLNANLKLPENPKREVYGAGSIRAVLGSVDEPVTRPIDPDTVQTYLQFLFTDLWAISTHSKTLERLALYDLRDTTVAFTENTDGGFDVSVQTARDFQAVVLVVVDAKPADLLSHIRESIANVRVFGVPLEILVQVDPTEVGVPRLVQVCIEFLEKHVETEGLFRMAGRLGKVTALQDDFNNRVPEIGPEYSPHDVTQVLKRFLAELPEPVFTHEGWRRLMESERVTVDAIRNLVRSLPQTHRDLARVLFCFFTIVTEASRNKMNASNLSIILAPCLLRPRMQGTVYTVPATEQLLLLNKAKQVVQLIIENSFDVFS
eukprot:m51a1_g11911 hypothetical protein (1036) ;mRNA; f:636230-640920